MTASVLTASGPDSGADLVHSSGRMRRRLLFDRVIGWALLLAFVVVLFPLFDMLYWIGANALPTMSWGTLTENQVGTGGGLYPMIQGTFVIIAIATAIAAALGVLAAFYTTEYAPAPIARIARIAGNLLAGVPAIVLGYFGYFLLVLYTGWGFTALGAAVTMAFFMIPYIYRTTDIALTSVPRTQREAALAIGSRRHQYLARIAFRIALPTILTGIFFAMALGLGEAAPILYTAGFSSTPITNLMQPTGTLAVAIWQFYDFPATYGHFLALAFQAAFLSIMIVLGLNVAVQLLSDRYRRRLRGLYQ